MQQSVGMEITGVTEQQPLSLCQKVTLGVISGVDIYCLSLLPRQIDEDLGAVEAVVLTVGVMALLGCCLVGSTLLAVRCTDADA
ncbi:MAG: hypothetical protein AB7F31_06795 [Parachlamydiales bacterium]